MTGAIFRDAVHPGRALGAVLCGYDGGGNALSCLIPLYAPSAGSACRFIAALLGQGESNNKHMPRAGLLSRGLALVACSWTLPIEVQVHISSRLPLPMSSLRQQAQQWRVSQRMPDDRLTLFTKPLILPMPSLRQAQQYISKHGRPFVPRRTSPMNPTHVFVPLIRWVTSVHPWESENVAGMPSPPSDFVNCPYSGATAVPSSPSIGSTWR